MIKNEQIKSVLEFAKYKYLICFEPGKDLAMIDQWACVRIITDPKPGNTKFSLLTAPGFHEVNFPIVIAHGYETTNLINVRAGINQVLVRVNTQLASGVHQSGFFIRSKKQSKSFRFFFASYHTNDLNETHHNLYMMDFKDDIIYAIEQCGMIP